MKINFNLNGREIKIDSENFEMLYDSLKKLGINSVKRSCESGNCGGCTVLVDNIPTLSCTFPTFRAIGRNIRTVEGLQDEIEKFAGFLADEGADQCGYCSSGFVMNVMHLASEMDYFDEAKISLRLSGNLCRCTGYKSQMRAIKRFIEEK